LARYAVVLLLLFTAGCAKVQPDPRASQPQPEVVATQAAAPQPVATPVAPTTVPPAPQPVATPVAPRTPPARPATPQPVATPVAPATPPPAPRVAAATAPLTLDLDALEAQLRATKAIGFFTKISLKNQVDDLMKQFREHYQGKSGRTMTDLRRSYDLLIMKVLSLLQDTDQKLASAIVSSREAIWALLSDQNKFANL
jgi:hypothetical protein